MHLNKIYVPLSLNTADLMMLDSSNFYRRHYMQCKRGLLRAIINCDPRLYSLSQQAKIASESSELFDLDDVTPLPGSGLQVYN